MSKNKFLKFLTSPPPVIAGIYASFATMLLLADAPLILGGLSLVALGRSGVSAAVQAFSAERNPLISSPLENMQDEDLSNDELNTDNSAEELEQSASSNSRELLTNAPTPSPIQVINCNPSGAGSWSAALISAISSGGTIDIGTTAVGCIVNLSTNTNNVNRIIDINLAKTGTTGITIKGASKFITFTGSNPSGFNFISPSGAGSITFADGLCLYQNGAGVFNFIVGAGVTATLSDGASIFNYAGSNVNIYVKSNGTMILKDQGYIQNNPFVGGGGMTTNVDSGGALIMSKGAYFWHGSTAGSGIANIQGLLSMDMSNDMPFSFGFYFMKVVVGSNGTLASGIGGSGFAGSELTIANATHQVMIGHGSYPPQLVSYPIYGKLITSNTTLLGSTLNVVTGQDLASLQGNYFEVVRVNGNTISGQYSALKFNGSDINIPYNIFYTKENVTVFFPTFAPTTSPSSPPSGVPSTPPSTPPSSIPSAKPTTYPSTLPTLETKKPSPAPSPEPSLAPVEDIPKTKTACKRLSVQKCQLNSFASSEKILQEADPDGEIMYSSVTVNDCLLQYHCVIVPDNSTSQPKKVLNNTNSCSSNSAPALEPPAAATAKFAQKGYMCALKSMNNCTMLSVDIPPAPQNLTLNSTYLTLVKAQLNCSSVYNCKPIAECTIPNAYEFSNNGGRYNIQGSEVMPVQETDMEVAGATGSTTEI